MGKRAINDDLKIVLSLEVFISNSKDPSKTINISPTVPNTGSISDKFGILRSKKLLSWRTAIPNKSNRITEGILVFEEVMSNKYANNNNTHIVIRIVIVIIEKIKQQSRVTKYLQNCRSLSLFLLNFRQQK